MGFTTFSSCSGGYELGRMADGVEVEISLLMISEDNQANGTNRGSSYGNVTLSDCNSHN